MLACIGAWSSAAGMQAFPEAAAGALALRGKVLILDVARISEPNVHTSYDGSAEGRDSPAIDAFFSRLVGRRLQGRVRTQTTRRAVVPNAPRQARRT